MNYFFKTKVKKLCSEYTGHYFLLALVFFIFLQPDAVLGLGSHSNEHGIGVQSLSMVDNFGMQMDVAVWYPAVRNPRMRYQTNISGWQVRAERNATPLEGKFPVILLSHDMGQSRLAQHDLCSFLASKGFVVIAPTHIGDSFESTSALFSAALFYHRPRQLLVALELVQAKTQLSSILDIENIGLLGVGAGAITVFQLSGVDINAGAHADYCATQSAEAVFCSDWASNRFSRLPKESAEIRKKFGNNAFVPKLENIKCVALYTPGGMFLLNKQGLASFKFPLAVVFSEKDEIYQVPINSSQWKLMFPEPLYEQVQAMTLPAVGHYSINADCPQDLSAVLSEQCRRVPPKSRQEASLKRDAYLVDFFSAFLHKN